MITGVVVMAYGTPGGRDEIEAYYTDIRRGRSPSAEQLADLVRRYDAIGGLSPLAARTEAQRAAIAGELDRSAPGEFVVATGLRHAAPSIEQAVAELAGAGAGRLVGLVLAPQYSAMSVGAYHERAGAAAAGHGLAYARIDSWATEPRLVDYLAGAVTACLREMPAATRVLFTAHSLPRRILETGDAYPAEVAATAVAVAAASGLRRWDQWSVGWQSAGRTADPWLGPDVLEVIDALAAAKPAGALLVCPCGFVADHLEVLYDLDVEARDRAERRGLRFERTSVVNDDAGVMSALARRILAAVAGRAALADGADAPVTRVIVVGGGISGLTTALLVAERTGGAVEVEVREASGRLGGALKTTPFTGRPAVDEGADAFLARVAPATDLARRLGLSLTTPEPLPAAVWHGRLHTIPDGVLLGVPGDVLRLARSRLLSIPGTLRAAVEPLLPRRGDPGDSIGALVRARFGDEVHVRLVDALVGSIYGADTDRFSLAMVPQLAALAAGGRSLLLGARRMRAAAPSVPGPTFYTPASGMGALADAVVEAAAARGVIVTTGEPVTAVERDGPGWRVDDRPADAVVLATPAPATAPLVAEAAADLGRLLATVDHASVAIVTLAVPDWPDRLRGRSGYLVPKDVQTTVTAVSFGSQKWAHWHDPRAGAEPTEVLRVSLGRDGLPVDHLDDAELVDRAVVEVGRHLGLDVRPVEVRVSRWPGAFPQYRPHHQRWLAAVDASRPPGLFTTGASYRGIGVPACIADAGLTTAAVTAALGIDH